MYIFAIHFFVFLCLYIFWLQLVEETSESLKALFMTTGVTHISKLVSDPTTTHPKDNRTRSKPTQTVLRKRFGVFFLSHLGLYFMCPRVKSTGELPGKNFKDLSFNTIVFSFAFAVSVSFVSLFLYFVEKSTGFFFFYFPSSSVHVPRAT